ncbi:acylneuraminate cytidylyltransferase family protein [Desulfonatronum parangueonense]
MIPARMGSQRLKQKNLKPLQGIPLIAHAIRKAKSAGVFDEIWVNSEHPTFGEIAAQEGVGFHRRPEELASNTATSEDFVHEFLNQHPCDYLIQVHSIAPLLTTAQVADFTRTLSKGPLDVLLSGVNEQIECMCQDQPVNFSFTTKTNSQELPPIQRITWSITGWKSATYQKAYLAGQCATYAGKVGFYPLDRMAGHIIKTEEDFQLAEMFLQVRQP